MSLRCLRRKRDRVAAAFVIAALASAAAGQAWSQQAAPSPPREPGDQVAVTGLFPGGGSPPPEDPRAKQYESNAQVISEGRHLFDTYNCSGCHFHGGGGMGPALMDDQWLYGDRLDQIYASIYQGRPRGMPAWSGVIPDGQIWELAAFVKSLSAALPDTGGGQAAPSQ
jgi:cytochrome c oxidase cbb3-type subunit III